MIVEHLQSGFPEGIVVPMAIRVLCDYLDKFGYPVSGCFEINMRGKEDAISWFPGDLVMQRQIAVFGKGSTGSTYALWLTRNPDPEDAPVVLLGSEGDFLVLALNSCEFCRLLGCGYDELEWDDLSQPPQLWAETGMLRNWLSKTLNVTSPATGGDIVKEANDQYPDFRKWVTKWQAANL